MTNEKCFRFTYSQGVEGFSKTLTKKIFATNEYEAKKLFTDEHTEQMNSTGIDKIKILNIDVKDLPALSDDEIQRASQMFPFDENPVIEMQRWKGMKL